MDHGPGRNGFADGPPDPANEGVGRPSATAANGSNHGPNGQFLAGNRAARGNPNARKMHQLRAAVLEAASPKLVQQIIRRMAVAALEDADVAAAKVVLEYTLGKPVQGVEVTGADGSPLGLDVARLVALICEALPGDRFAEARLTLAARLQKLSLEVADAQRDVD